ncbi:hypothetical protein BRC68_10450 [Halobacteriales archaeon QH_6_64_20]|nr:MAG: hypothetical protein BRC68_10450 [Halobacteriales archaeon QH_6_64_20]
MKSLSVGRELPGFSAVRHDDRLPAIDRVAEKPSEEADPGSGANGPPETDDSGRRTLIGSRSGVRS